MTYLFCNLVKTTPKLEKTLSREADDAGIPRSLLANVQSSLETTFCSLKATLPYYRLCHLWDKVNCKNSAFPFQTFIFPGFTGFMVQYPGF